MLAVGAGGGCLDIFSLIYLFSFLSPSLWETARHRLKYCLKGPLNPKQPTNHPVPGRPTILITVGQGPIALAVGAGGGGLDIFTLIYPFSSFSLSLGDGPIWTEILSQRAVKPKTTNQPTNHPEKIKHLFWYCNVVVEVWELILRWLFENILFSINTNKQIAIFRINVQSNEPVNYILIITRYCI